MDALGRGRSEREVRKWEKCSCPEREKELFTPIIMAPRAAKHTGARGGTRRGRGRKLSLRRLVEEAKNGILVKWQKVFDAGLGK